MATAEKQPRITITEFVREFNRLKNESLAIEVRQNLGPAEAGDAMAAAACLEPQWRALVQRALGAGLNLAD
jgi:hypothetical protein